MSVFRPVTIEFQALNVTNEFTLNGEWMERYEPGTGKPTIDLGDAMVKYLILVKSCDKSDLN